MLAYWQDNFTSVMISRSTQLFVRRREAQRRSTCQTKPIGSGFFAIAAGVAFLLRFICSLLYDLKTIDLYVVFQCWLLFAATILTIWGSDRVFKVRSDKPRRWWKIGKSTFMFVVGAITATFAIFAFVQ